MVMLHAHPNNHTQTIFALFLEAGKEYGFSLCMRGDCGGKNVEVIIWMIKHHGLNRVSFMWGR